MAPLTPLHTRLSVWDSGCRTGGWFLHCHTGRVRCRLMGNSRRARKTASARQRQRATVAPARQQSRRWLRPLLTVAILGVLGALVFFISVDISDNPQGRAEVPDGVQILSVPEPGHTEAPVSYPHDPPAGGQHNPVWLQCRVYDEPVVNENAVHALEHGAVWITYRPDLDQSGIDRLVGDFGRSSEVIVSPYPGLDSPVVVTAWARQMRVESADDPRIEAFVRSLRDTTAPENSASC